MSSSVPSDESGAPEEIILNGSSPAADTVVGIPDDADLHPHPDDLSLIRALILKAYPDVVPDLVAGTSATDLLASVDAARNAYAHVLEQVRATTTTLTGSSPTAGRPVVVVPAGGGAPLPIDPDRLPASEKIRRGLVLGAGRRSS